MLLSLSKRLANRALAFVGQEIVPLSRPAAPEPTQESPPFYQPAKTCQIHGLAFIYEKFFGLKSSGVFVEVGAFDGESYSNTSCLADVGWQGHYIEPVPDFYSRCVSRHAGNRNTQVYNIGIGDRDGEIALNTGGPMTTANREHFEAFLKLEWSKPDFADSQLIRSLQTTLNAFLESHGVPVRFDLLVIDVEGYEQAVFSGFDLGKWRPTMMIVELGDTKSDLPHFHRQYAELYAMICSQGYYVVYKDPINTIFVTKEHYQATYSI